MLTRRQALRRLAGLAATAMLPAGLAGAMERARSGSGPRPRLAVIGGGMGGIATAWFCDPVFEVALFEAGSKLGGHCDSRSISVAGRPLVTDLGAQFFHPGTHPLYVELLDELGILTS